MKKAFKIALLFALLTLALSITAGAQYTDFTKVPTEKVITPKEGQYTVTATNTGTSDAQCVVLVLKGLWEESVFTSTIPLRADSILYIDQKTVPANNGTTNGTIDFTVYPKSLPDSTVILTGLTQNPQVVGYTEGKGVSVSGTVEFLGAKTTAKVTLTPASGGDAISITTAKGAYALSSVLAGTYTLKIEKIGHVTYTKLVVINDTDTNLGTLNMYGGRIKTPSTASVQFEDLAALLGEYEKNLSILTADINEDDLVNFTDLSAVLSSYEKGYIA